ncbi:MAG: hypothetical protein A4E31_00167 [Methanomassiliicoccales archaeon PtaU1.Bin030]|nr:MAG: hypothetical protein A4E31_00167 [Methanomassiliicoccales archaeon PtaU1.Bin030]
MAILRSTWLSMVSRASWATMVSTSATDPPASLALMMMEVILLIRGVSTLSANSRMASEAGTPQSIWAAILRISGVSLP